GQASLALRTAENVKTDQVGPLELLEFETTRELARAAAGAPPARAEARCIPHNEILTLQLAAPAIRAAAAGTRRSTAIDQLRRHVQDSNCVEGFVIAYRAVPCLLARSIDDRQFRDFIGPTPQRPH